MIFVTFLLIQVGNFYQCMCLGYKQFMVLNVLIVMVLVQIKTIYSIQPIHRMLNLIPTVCRFENFKLNFIVIIIIVLDLYSALVG